MQTVIALIGYIEAGTLILLAVLSVWSIGVMIDRRRVFRSVLNRSVLNEAEALVRAGDPNKLTEWLKGREGTVAEMIRAMREAPSQRSEAIDPAARSFLQKERQRLEKGLNVLATLGANAPFIGLFGTVLGIIQAFSALSTEQTGSGTVMASIAKALVATAAGLFVAIPAVVAFNTFSSRLRTVITSLEALKNLYLSRLNGR